MPDCNLLLQSKAVFTFLDVFLTWPWSNFATCLDKFLLTLSKNVWAQHYCDAAEGWAHSLPAYKEKFCKLKQGLWKEPTGHSHLPVIEFVSFFAVCLVDVVLLHSPTRAFVYMSSHINPFIGLLQCRFQYIGCHGQIKGAGLVKSNWK